MTIRLPIATSIPSGGSPAPRAPFMPGPLRSVHLELTTRCNARCPMCPRTGRGVARAGLAMIDLSRSDIEAILPPPILRGLTRIDICGGFGDPLMAEGFDEILDYLRREREDLDLNIFTNGSLRSARWWSELAGRVGGHGRVVFGLDGLADTHAIYRADTSFEKVIHNATEFIGGGGTAQWDFLVFRHNQHQVDEARALAERLGFATFSAKVSGRFFKRYYEETPDLEARYGYESFPAYDRDGNHLLDLELPTDPRFENPTLERLQDEFRAHGSLNPALDAACIDCRAITDRSCFVSAEGTVFPCCWTYGASKYGSVFGMSGPENMQVADLLERSGGPSAINAKIHPIEAILNGPFFHSLADTWPVARVEDGKAKICARMCGATFSQEDQYEDARNSPWRASAPPEGR